MTTINKWKPTSWGRRNSSAQNNWEEISIDSYKRTKPLVVCLSGNSAISSRDANGFCKRAERQLELILNKSRGEDSTIDIIGCAYGHNVKYIIPEMTEEERQEFFRKYPNPRAYGREFPEYVKENDIGHLDEEEVNGFVDNILLPECFDMATGKPLPLDTACKNLSQITFFTWCHGDREVFRIFNKFSKKCEKTGMAVGDIFKLFISCFHVCYAPITRASMLPTIGIDSLADRNNIDYSMVYETLNGVDIKYEYPDFSKNIFFDIIHIFTSKLTNISTKDINEHSIQYLDRTDSWDIADGHPNADCVSQMMSWALCVAVDNSIKNSKSESYIPKPSMLSIMNELKSIKNSFTENDLMHNMEQL